MRSLRGRTPHPRAGSGLGRSDLTPTDGVIGLGELKIRSVAHRQAEISYAVHTVLWGQGYGEAIARSLVEVGRAEGMHRIAGTCDPRNGASARVLQKIGMSYEGRMRHTPEQPEKDEPGWSPTLRHQHGEPARAVAADPAVQAGPADLHRRPESDDVAAGAIEQMASTGGILADLF